MQSSDDMQFSNTETSSIEMLSIFELDKIVTLLLEQQTASLEKANKLREGESRMKRTMNPMKKEREKMISQKKKITSKAGRRSEEKKNQLTWTRSRRSLWFENSTSYKKNWIDEK